MVSLIELPFNRFFILFCLATKDLYNGGGTVSESEYIRPYDFRIYHGASLGHEGSYILRLLHINATCCCHFYLVAFDAWTITQ